MSANIQISSETAKGCLRIDCSKEQLQAYFEMVCKIINSTIGKNSIKFDNYEIKGEHLCVSFNNGDLSLTEFDILAAISTTPIDEIIQITKLKKQIDSIIPLSNRAYHTLSKVIDSHLMGCRLVGSKFYGATRKSYGSKTYLMTDSVTGFTKIGRADDCVARERTLQCERPTIKLLAVCDEMVETELHRKFKPKRLRGEWFNLTKEEVKNIIDEYGFHDWQNNRKPKI